MQLENNDHYTKAFIVNKSLLATKWKTINGVIFTTALVGTTGRGQQMAIVIVIFSAI
jgi:hypothetical protein